MADPYADIATPTGSPSVDPYAAIAVPTAAKPAGDGGIMDTINTGVNWLGTNATKAATSILGAPRDFADLKRAALQYMGVPPQLANALNYIDPITVTGQFGPSSADLNEGVFKKMGVPEVQLPGKLGHAVDVGVQTVMQTPFMPGSVVRNALPAFVGGTAQELAGQAAEGSPWEIPVRLLVGAGAGLATAGAQNAAGNLAKATTNVLGSGARDVDTQSARILGRAIERDKTTFNALQQAHAAYPEGTPFVGVGGENVRGVARGSTASPGPARTTVAKAAEDFTTGSDARVGAAISQNVSDAPPVSTRVAALETERTGAANPAYRAAGIPSRIQVNEELKPGAPYQSMTISPEGLPVDVTRQNAPEVVRSFNTPTVTSPAIEALLRDSADVKAAIAAARRLPDFKNLPSNSMAMLDKAYKHLGAMEREAITANNGERAYDIGNVRKDFVAAITQANPKYGEALAAYSEPSKLIDAANAGKEAFAKNRDVAQVRREFEMMPADQQKEFLGGVADWMRTRAGNTDRATAAERIWNSKNIRERLKGILPPDKFQQFATLMDQDKTVVRALRGITQGSRTTPMALEAADNAGVGNALTKAMRGRYLSALLDTGNVLAGRALEGRTQAINARLAEWLTETDPAKVGLVRALAAKAQLEEIARTSGRRNALITGAALPASASVRRD